MILLYDRVHASRVVTRRDVGGACFFRYEVTVRSTVANFKISICWRRNNGKTCTATRRGVER